MTDHTSPDLIYRARSLRYSSALTASFIALPGTSLFALWTPGDLGLGPFYLGEWDGVLEAYTNRPRWQPRPTTTKADRTSELMKDLGL